jgi:integrase
LEPIWSAKPETASRVRQRIERVLDFAKVSGLREGENPARWRGHLDHLLPPLSKVRRVEHHAAMPYEAVPAFVARLRVQDGVASLALEFAILTAARTGEVLGARWGEVDLGAAVWTVPAERMKAGRAHRVPLPHRAVELLTELRGKKPPAPGDLVFPGLRPGRSLSNMAMLALLRRFKLDVTVHGFRSSFRTWAAERSAFPTEVVEMALAHTIRSAVVAAYQRGDLFEKRRLLMQQWADYLDHATDATIVTLRGK